MGVAQISAGEFHPTVVARVLPRNVLLLDVHKHICDLDKLPAAIPATLHYSAIPSRDAVTLAQMVRKLLSWDISSAARGIIHPLTCVEPVLWGTGNPDEHKSVFVREVLVEFVAIGVCSIVRHGGCVERGE